MKSRKAMIFSLLLIFINQVIGNILPPYGIFLTPLLLLITTILFLIPKNPNILVCTIYCYLAFAINDIGLKLFAGGTHDAVGGAWISVFGVIGSIISYVILIFYMFNDKHKNYKRISISIILFPILVIIHFYLLMDFGVNVHY
jgi:hypothetical protein